MDRQRKLLSRITLVCMSINSLLQLQERLPPCRRSRGLPRRKRHLVKRQRAIRLVERYALLHRSHHVTLDQSVGNLVHPRIRMLEKLQHLLGSCRGIPLKPVAVHVSQHQIIPQQLRQCLNNRRRNRLQRHSLIRTKPSRIRLIHADRTQRRPHARSLPLVVCSAALEETSIQRLPDQILSQRERQRARRLLARTLNPLTELFSTRTLRIHLDVVDDLNVLFVTSRDRLQTLLGRPMRKMRLKTRILNRLLVRVQPKRRPRILLDRVYPRNERRFRRIPKRIHLASQIVYRLTRQQIPNDLQVMRLLQHPQQLLRPQILHLRIIHLRLTRLT